MRDTNENHRARISPEHHHFNVSVAPSTVWSYRSDAANAEWVSLEWDFRYSCWCVMATDVFLTSCATVQL